MKDETFVPERETEIVSTDAQSNAVSDAQTKTAATTVAATVDPRDEQIAAMRRELDELKRSQQSLQDKTIAAVKKQIGKKHQSIDELAASEGWDAEAVRQRKEREAQKVLLQLGSTNLQEDDEQPITQNAPNAPVTEVSQQMQLIRAHLAELGLTEADFGQEGLKPFEGMQRGSPEARRFERLKGLALDRKEQTATQQAKQMQREKDAATVKQSLDQYGGLGSIESGGEAQLKSPIMEIDDSRELYRLARQQMQKNRR